MYTAEHAGKLKHLWKNGGENAEKINSYCAFQDRGRLGVRKTQGTLQSIEGKGTTAQGGLHFKRLKTKGTQGPACLNGAGETRR